jgi:hypothetical protein
MRKLEYEFVKARFEREGCSLLSNEFKNGYQKLDYICQNNHNAVTTYRNFFYGNRKCIRCWAESKKKNIEDIKLSFEDAGYTLLSFDYKHAHDKLNYICDKGHNHYISWAKWQQGKRCLHCHHEKMSILHSGVGHPMWKGGISCEPYCDVWLDKEFKESIKERDNYQCQNPDCFGTSEKLCIHHIDYDKKNCEPKNLITLCNSCNSRANVNRDWHTKFYKEIIINKENYKFREV